jgi:ribosomal RNA-processing protein 1
MPAVKSKGESHAYIKKLAANDRPTRDAALKSLTQFLGTGKKIDEMELLKLWKGLFFTMWFSDRPRTQQRLADDLAGLLAVVNKVNFFSFLEAFWSIMAREWEGIDQHRIDKFYLLLRRYVAATFRRIQSEDWDQDWILKYQEVMSHYPLNIKDPKVPNALRLHMFDIYLDEIDRVLKEQEEENEQDVSERVDRVPFEQLLKPIKDISEDSPLKFIRQKARREVLEDQRLVEWGVVKVESEEDDDDEDENDEWGGFD